MPSIPSEVERIIIILLCFIFWTLALAGLELWSHRRRDRDHDRQDRRRW